MLRVVAVYLSQLGCLARTSFGAENRGEDSTGSIAMADELAATTEALRLDDSKVDEGSEEGEIVEKLVDRPAETKKHPLEHSWTFWFDNPNGKQKQATWGSSLRPVYTFHTVEEFWWYVVYCLVHHLGFCCFWCCLSIGHCLSLLMECFFFCSNFLGFPRDR